MLNIDVDDCEEVRYEGIPHYTPKGDCETHTVPECKCGTMELKLGEHTIAVLHLPFDKRDLVDAVFSSEGWEDALPFRREYHNTNKGLVKAGKISMREYQNRWLKMEGAVQERFQNN